MISSKQLEISDANDYARKGSSLNLGERLCSDAGIIRQKIECEMSLWKYPGFGKLTSNRM